MEMVALHILAKIVKKLVPVGHNLKRLHYYKTGTTLSLGIKELLFDTNVEDMFNAGYDNEQNIEDIDCYSSDDYEEIENVDFQNEANDNIVIKDFSTPYPFLNKLSSTRAVFRGKKGMNYTAFDPTIPWDKMERVLGMRYETPRELKFALTNFGVAHGYQLWFMNNDLKSVLVFYRRNVKEGRCAGKKDKKDKAMPNTYRFAEALMEKCKRAKHMALFDYEGGLIKHQSRLYDYMQAILDSNHG
ncbi:hypothetical protein Tco_1151337 [Tanacetum coccineum]